MANNKPLKYTKLLQIWMTPEMADELTKDARILGMSNSEFGRAVFALWGQYKRSLLPQANGHAHHPEASHVRRV